jgi:hypothetical protein
VKTIVASLLIFAVGCGAEAPSPGARIGGYRVTVVVSPGWLFKALIVTDGRFEVTEEEAPNRLGVTRIAGSFAFGSSSWNDARCISAVPPADCGADQSGNDGRQGRFTGTISANGCVHLDLRTPDYPAAGTAQRWQGSLVAGGFDFHSGKAPCYEGVEGFAFTPAQAWVDRDSPQ